MLVRASVGDPISDRLIVLRPNMSIHWLGIVNTSEYETDRCPNAGAEPKL